MFYLIKRRKLEILHRRALNFPKTPYAQIQVSAHAILREHQLLSSLGVPYLANFRNQESKSQRFLMSFLCYVLSTHVILTGFYYHRSLTHASD
jgi:hypothetical protein